MERLDEFLTFSTEVTAFKLFELHGTGQAETYFSTIRSIVGPVLDALLDAYRALPTDPAGRGSALRRQIFGDEKLGPIARNIVKIWYIGIWYQLPRAWTDKFGALPGNVSFMATPAAYAEGLLWRAIGGNPPGARAPGYGSWADPPQIPTF